VIESKSVNEKVLNRIKNSDQFKTLIETLESARSSEVSVENSYAYKSKNSDDDNYTVVINIDDSGQDKISLVFKMNKEDDIINCSVNFDEITNGKPEVSHILDPGEDSVHIKSKRDN
jgi:hypothetical protein